MLEKHEAGSTQALLKKLTDLGATSGFEFEAAKNVCELFSKYMSVSVDALGNVVAKANENGKIKVLLDAHLDRIGLVIRGIDDGGFLLVDKVGGIDERVLTGAQVKVFGREELLGVICSTPPHLLTDADKEKGVEISKIAIDIGFDKKTAESYVSVGDRAVVHSENGALLKNCVFASALDDRSGVAAVINAANALCGKLSNVSLTMLLSSQEETGGSGAKVGAYNADSDYAIAVDVGFGATDAATSKSGETIELGKGPSIGISPVLDRELMLKLKKLAEDNNIPYQHDVMSPRTGTNADSICISKGGVKTALLSIPLKYMHTPVEVVDIEDIDNTSALIEMFILSLEDETNA